MNGLSNREKHEFYSGLARLVRSGTSLPTALELLARDTPRRVGKFLRALNARINAGEPLADALLEQRPRVSELEASIIKAASRGGRMDRGCDQLARYYDALVRARREMTSRMAYPVLMLHVIAPITKIELLFTASAKVYLIAVLTPLLVIYAVGAALCFGWLALKGAARTNVFVDRLLAAIPGIGTVRGKFALARFFATLDAQLEAAVNIWEAFANAARTSDSASIIAAARRAMPLLQGGERLSEALARERVIPPAYIRAFRVAEQAGELDAELVQLAQKSEEEAVVTLNRWSEWLPRLIYGAVMLYGGWQIVHTYQASMNQVQQFDPFNQ